ncbi:MAG: hypothetical protein HQL11_02630 [Candidatus Omnitrophica bacterium]|nr:hypothetical protein [Candidatus Omnitrophota bacterium]
MSGKLKFVFVFFLTLAMAGAVPAFADEISDLKAQLAMMQNQIQMLQGKIEVLEKDRQTRIQSPQDAEDRLLAVEEKLDQGILGKITSEQLKVSGFVQPFYRWSENDSANDTFDVLRGFVTLNGTIAEDIDYALQVDAAASTDILRDAWVEYTKYKFAKIKFGQFPAPFSYEWNISSAGLDTVDRALVSSNLAYKRDLGLMAEGDVLDGAVYYGAGVFNGTARNTADNNDKKDFIGRMIVSPLKNDDGTANKDFHVAGAIQTGDQPRSGNTHGTRTRGSGAVFYRVQKLKLYGEYIYQEIEGADGFDSADSDGWYVIGTYEILPKIEAVFKYEQYDPNLDTSGDRQDITTLGVTYRVTSNVILQANYRIREEQYKLESSNNEFVTLATVKF